MQTHELEKFLQTQIPLVATLGVRVIQANDDLVELRAPLEPNRNHLGTVFGGSIYSTAVLACYAWLYNVLKNRNLECHVVIKSGQIKYIRPVNGDFSCVCFSPAENDFEKFLLTLERKQRGQISLRSEIKVKSDVVCIFEGEFVAIL
ncbi:MAG: hypothetical protein A2622_14275 [Bdellovibrionales bacterium RIFCSPHIGHO2_01_FULL_40_29]|nr:MAG: hypothetical protein A2622_14275 [Bdellovibrionales bacterium RIFCSPHIGHO2_01_FULL_40_29]OFZ33687.1 MAG: hypothetical protein A3D17_11885 [Bdellovibrionales bacterium RIFCSPHIGHO2_02_FULL_40_15]